MVSDLVGKRFARLVVVERVENDHAGNSTWRCICDCGTERRVLSGNLKRGSTRSCGCLAAEQAKRRKHALPEGRACRNVLLLDYMRKAEDHRLEWGIPEEKFDELVAKNCHYCDSPPSNTKRGRGNNGVFVYNGIDRRDNTRGYLLDNVVPCCSVCNWMKRHLSVAEFLSHVRKISNKNSEG